MRRRAASVTDEAQPLALVAASVIPYIRFSTLTVGPFSVVGAGLTIVGVVIALVVAHRRAKRFGIDTKQLDSFVLWLMVGGVIGGHLADVLAYRLPEVVELADGQLFWREPWEIAQFWHGWRSVGGFAGALLGASLWRRYTFASTTWLRLSGFVSLEGYWFVRRARSEPILALSDVTLSVFPVAWAFNRVGSAFLHDHPGSRATPGSLLAVAYPDSRSVLSDGFILVHGSVPRYDLGLLELIITLLLLACVLLTWKKAMRTGMYVCLVGLVYPPARFLCDFLARKTGSAVDPRFLALTPAQWGFAALSLLSAFMLLKLWLTRVESRLIGLP